MTSLVEHYRRLAASADPSERLLAVRQLARLQHRPASTHDAGARPSRWAHVPIAGLFAEAGNVLRERRSGTLETGHEPVHGSRSGACVVLWPAEGRWYCRSCRRGGDAIAALMSPRGRSFHRARIVLRERYGVPPAERPRRAGHE